MTFSKLSQNNERGEYHVSELATKAMVRKNPTGNKPVY